MKAIGIILAGGNNKLMTVKALPSIIKQIKAKNYELLPVDESMILIQHNNGNQEEGK